MSRIFGMVTTAASGDYTVAALESFFQNTRLEADDASFSLIDNDGNPRIHPARRSRKLQTALKRLGESTAAIVRGKCQSDHFRTPWPRCGMPTHT